MSLVLSFAVHAGALLLVVTLALPRRPVVPAHELTIALTMLPTVPIPSEPPPSTPALDASAADAATPMIPEVNPVDATTAAAADVKPSAQLETASSQAPLAAASAVVPAVAPVAPDTSAPLAPEGATTMPAPDVNDSPSGLLAQSQEAVPVLPSSRVGEKNAEDPRAAAAGEQPNEILASASLVDAAPGSAPPPATALAAEGPSEAVSANEAPSDLAAEAPSVAQANEALSSPPAGGSFPSAVADTGERLVPLAALDMSRPAASARLPAEGTLQAIDPPNASPPAPPPVLALATPESAVALDAPEDEAALRRAGAFVDTYDGGPCVFVSTVRLASSLADIDSFAVSNAQFETFDRLFSAALGFAPRVTGQHIWSPQCPAVDYLRRLHAHWVAPPLLGVDAVEVGNGGTLHGTISDAAHRPLHLFLVSETGTVEDLTKSLVATGQDTHFAIMPRRSTVAGDTPQLLVAVAGSLTPDTGANGPKSADAFFRALNSGRDAPGAAAKLFLLGH